MDMMYYCGTSTHKTPSKNVLALTLRLNEIVSSE